MRLGRRVAAGLVIIASQIILTSIAPVSADSLTASQRLFDDGKFLLAGELATQCDCVSGYALAARSLTAHARFQLPEDERGPVLERAVALAEAGLAIGPDDPEMLVAAATAIGRYGRVLGTLRSLNDGVVERGRQLLEAALAADPTYPPAIAGLGAWHGRIAGKGGNLANALFNLGVDRELGIRLMEQAEPLVADNVPILFELARAWRDLGEDERARQLLEQAVAVEVNDAYSEIFRGRAESLLARL